MAFTSQTTSMPNGLTNAAPWQTMAEAGTPDPTWSQLYFDDFMQYLATLYSVVGTGTPVVAAVGGAGAKGGLVNLLTTAAAADTANIQLPIANFQATPGKHLFYKAQITPVSTAAVDLYCGLFAVGANPLAGADFIGIVVLTGTRLPILRMRIGSVNTDVAFPATCVVADGTPVELGFHVDQQGNVEAFWNPTTGANSPVVTGSGAARGRVAAFQNAASGTQVALTQVLLSPTVGLRTTGAAARNLNVDYMVCSAER